MFGLKTGEPKSSTPTAEKPTQPQSPWENELRLRQQLDQQQFVQPDLASMRKIGARQLKEVLSVRSKAAMIELDAYLTSRHQRDALAVRSWLFAEVSRAGRIPNDQAAALVRSAISDLRASAGR